MLIMVVMNVGDVVTLAGSPLGAELGSLVGWGVGIPGLGLVGRFVSGGVVSGVGEGLDVPSVSQRGHRSQM